MRLLVTGATGFLGTELVPRLFKAGHQVYSLSRHGPLVGDITREGLGLKEVPQVDAVVHLAGLVSFRQADWEALYAVNARGARNVCQLCLEKEVPLFHVSTAYICGNARGVWSEEDYHRGQRFRNTYEFTKFLGEEWVRWAVERGLRATIFRPGILVGRSSDGRATAFEGFYYPLKALLTCQRFVERVLPPRPRVEKALRLPPLPLNIRVTGNPRGTLNLVPVDWAAQRIADLLEVPPGTYHLTNPSPPTNQEVARSVCQGLGVQGIRFSPKPRHDPLSDLYNRLIRPFAPYLWGEPVFQSSTASNFPGLDIGRIINYWRTNAQGLRREAGPPTPEAGYGSGGRAHGEEAGKVSGPPGGPLQGQ